MGCLFCKIVNGEIQADILYRDDLVVGFKDINPVAPQHILIIPKKHISTVNDFKLEDNNLIGHMMQAAKLLAKEINVDGYRLVMNCNESAGQTVYHVHLHLLAGRDFTWPPG
ncbi:histidine triad nucleotide-binding protein [Gammaproteobacteria bacterium]|nr:histidine triad nucleotide-binding protein [Gammaproteobacteria bacterium]